MPSKFYGIAAAGSPMLAITPPDVEIADLVRPYQTASPSHPAAPKN